MNRTRYASGSPFYSHSEWLCNLFSEKRFFSIEVLLLRKVRFTHVPPPQSLRGRPPYSLQSANALTNQALLINSANLMGGSSEPDKVRGFGRVHLEPGMPLAGGAGNPHALFVTDAVAHNTSTPELTATDYPFRVDCGAGLDLRATLSWIDPPSSALSAVQLLHDLDLAVFSPTGVRYTMWHSGDADSVNVIERIIVPVSHLKEYDVVAPADDDDDVEVSKNNDTWVVRVWSKRLTVEAQAYSLVVTGAISPVWHEQTGSDRGGGSEVGEDAVDAAQAASTASWLLGEDGPAGVVSACCLVVVVVMAWIAGGL